jgi:thiosulfate reductase cytochrome b subunit
MIIINGKIREGGRSTPTPNPMLLGRQVSSALPRLPANEDIPPTGDARWKGRRAQPLTIRLNHWINVLLIVFMAGSGLEIFASYPALGPLGAQYAWYPWQDFAPPPWLRIGGWLTGARHLHFAFAWFLVLNGCIYVGYFFLSGEWRRRLFLPRRDARNALLMFGYYLRILRTHPGEDFYNGLQRFAYTSVLILITIQVLSGLAIYKPVQLHWLTTIFGGYDAARVFHLLGLVLLAFFVTIHVVMVSLHPRNLFAIVTGGKRD